MSHELAQAALEVLPETELRPAARFALVLLAMVAHAECPIAWGGRNWLAKRSGYSADHVGDAIKELAEGGQISVWHKEGRAALYLVHPRGIDALGPINTRAILARLHGAIFPAREVIEWMIGLGVVHGRTVPADQAEAAMPERRATS